jgi:hypothetical protein
LYTSVNEITSSVKRLHTSVNNLNNPATRLYASVKKIAAFKRIKDTPISVFSFSGVNRHGAEGFRYRTSDEPCQKKPFPRRALTVFCLPACPLLALINLIKISLLIFRRVSRKIFNP